MSSGMDELARFNNRVAQAQSRAPSSPPAERPQHVVTSRRPDEVFPEDDPVIPGKLISAQGAPPAEKLTMKKLIDQLEELEQSIDIDSALSAPSRVPRAQGRGVIPRLANQARGELDMNPAVREIDAGLGEAARADISAIIAAGMGVDEEHDEDSAYDFRDIADDIIDYLEGDDHDGGDVGHKVNQKAGRGTDGDGSPGEFATRRKWKKKPKKDDKHDWDNEMDGQGAPGDDET